MKPEKLLVMACGGKKVETHGKLVNAIDLYAGRQFDLARKLYAEGWEVLILSAEHGLIHAEHKIATYNREMTRDRAIELSEQDLQWHILRIYAQDADEIVFYGGELYHDVWDAAIDANGFDVRNEDGKEVIRIIGAGCGDHYSVLKEIVAEESGWVYSETEENHV